MKTKVILFTFLFFLGICFFGWGQTCPQANYSLSSQAAVNNFPSTCNSISGNLEISGSVTDLTPLAHLTSVGGFLTISNTSGLTTASFPNLSSIGSIFTIGDNSSLTTLNFPLINSIFHFYINNNPSLSDTGINFPNLTTMTLFQVSRNGGITSVNFFPSLNSVYIFAMLYEPNLTDVSALNSYQPDVILFESCPGVTSLTLTDSNFSLEIYNSSNLTSIQLPNLSSTSDFRLSNNPSLTTLSAPNLTSVNNLLSVSGNSNLSDCCDLFPVINMGGPGTISIVNNATGCATVQEIVPCPALNSSVPTLSEWGLILLGLILGTCGAIAVFRKKYEGNLVG